jgi:hypothetical protein
MTASQKGSPLRFTIKSSTDVDTCNDESIVEVEYSTNICDVNESPTSPKDLFCTTGITKGTGTSGARIPLTSDLNTLGGRKHAYRKKNKQKRKKKLKKKNKKKRRKNR